MRVSHRSLAGSTAARSVVYETSPDRFLLLSSFAFDSSVAGIFWTLTTGGALFIAPERIEQDLEALAGLIRRERITHTLLLPTVYRALLASRWAETIARSDGEEVSPGDVTRDDDQGRDRPGVYDPSRTRPREYDSGRDQPGVYDPGRTRPRENDSSGDPLIGHDQGGCVSTIIVAGEACPSDLVRRHFEVLGHVALYNEYGPTEGTVWSAVHRVRASDAEGSVPIGSAVPGYALYVVDRHLRPVPHGASGELLVGGDLLADGYVGDGALTEERFLEDPFRGHGRVYRTGDLVRRRPDGLLEFVGRLDGQVKIRGFRIEPDEIARALLEHPDVREAVVVVTRPGAETRVSSGTRPQGTRSEVARTPAEPPQERPATSTAQPPERLSTSITQPPDRLLTSTRQPEANPATGGLPADTGRVALVAYAAVRSTVDAALLRDFLRSRLPEHMVPSSIVLLETLPRLPNGKIDTASLPDPGHLTRHGEQTHIGPRNEPEALLHQIWAEVLGTSDFGVTDDFYRIGGDSILSIHVISRARDAGFTFTPAEFFQARTIDRLAPYHQTAKAPLDGKAESASDSGIHSGPVPLSPIQHWFFEEHPTDPHHWGQTLDLAWQTSPEETDADPHHRGQTRDLDPQIHPEEEEAGPPEDDPEASSGAVRRRSSSTDPAGPIRSALNALLHRHDALRSRFMRTEDGAWQAEIVPRGLETPLDVLECPESDRREPGGHTDLEEQIDTWVAAAHGGMRLDEPPLMRALLVTREGQPARLVLALHHLVVDAVSWSLLVEELRLLLRPGTPPIGSEGASYTAWLQALESVAQARHLEEEIPFWLAQQGDDLFPSDTTTSDAPREEDIAYRTLKLDSSVADPFLGDANVAYRTRPVDLFVAAFIRAWHLTTGATSITVAMEGHGRDPEPISMDPGRTVGWLTTFYPVRFDVPADGSIRSLIRTTKERIRAVPDGGLGYGLLRYWGRIPGMGNRKLGDIVINYLGRIDHAWDAGKGLRVQGFRVPGARSPRVERGHPLEVNGWIARQRLHIDIGRSTRHMTAEMADRFARNVEDSVRLIVSHCLETEEFTYTPSDFPDVDLNQDDLDALLGTLD